MNFLHTGRISLDSVAENIMTCLSCGVILKISWTSARMSSCSSILSHSSRMKWPHCLSQMSPSLASALQRPGGGDDDAGGLLLELRLLLLDVDAAEDDGDVHRGEVRAEALELVLDLVRQLARVAEDQRANLARDGLELLEDREHEHRGLAHAGLGLADDVHAQDRLGDALVLNC